MTCKAMTLMVSSQAGGPLDLIARRFAQEAEQDGVQAVVMNNGSATGHAAAGAVARAPACTVLFATSGIALLPVMHPESAQSVYGKLQPAGMIARSPLVLAVHKDGPKSLEELIAASKAKPGGLNYATGGNAGPGHIATEMLLKHFQTEGTPVPFPGAGPAVNALLGKHVDFVLTAPAAVGPHTKDLRILGVARDTPIQMAGVGQVEPLAPGVRFSDAWIGIYTGPAADKTTVGQVHSNLQRLLKNPTFRQTFEKDFAMELAVDVTTDQFAEVSAQQARDSKAGWELVSKR